MMPVNKEIVAFGLDGRQHRFNVPKRSQKSTGENYVAWTWKHDDGSRRRLSISLMGIIYYEEVVPE